ncbi:hypothetical protein [Altererythrobacter sp. GH1-8]|uniref:hypothetical protein n=1 Tax=Altererythrobacter sp. GH1-8 TaxID=3349333 RepID=UPI00374CDCA6
MNVPSQALQFGGSLIAILVLAWLVKKLGLGATRRLTDDSQAIAVAGEVSDGFAPIEVALDKQGQGALLRDAAGQIMLVKPHGVHFAGRILGPSAHAQRDREALAIDPGEKRFGMVTLQIDDPAPWEDAINRLNATGNA